MKKLARGAMSVVLAPFLFVIAVMSAAIAATPLVDAAWLENRLGNDGIASGSLHGWIRFVMAMAGSWVGIRARPSFGLAA